MASGLRGGRQAVVRDLAAALADREAQWRAFAVWERDQAPPDDGAQPSAARVAAALDWYAEALEFAERVGSAGAAAPESHLEDLVAWVRRWRAAWRAR